MPIDTSYSTRWYFPLDLELYKISIGLRSWLKRNLKTFDVVHAHALFSFAPIVAASMARKMGVPYVLRPLGVLSRYGMSSRRAFQKKLSLGLVERRLLEAANAVHFTSMDEQSEAEAMGLKCNGQVIPLGINIGSKEIVRSRWQVGEQVTLLFLSRIDPKKNLEGLLQALTLEPLRKMDLRLLVAGDGEADYVSKIKEMADRLGISGRIEWLGYVDGARKADALASSTVFVLPSYSENFGIAVVEALGASLPCIVSSGVAISVEIVDAGAGVVSEVGAASIGECILAIVRNQNDYDRMSIAARSLAIKQYSIEVMGDRLEGLYRSIVNAKSGKG
jgi:glycosyltransferase involved in cell wall biosynthesis